MRRSDAHEYRQAYNAQAVVCADGPQLILATNLVATSADAPSFAATVLGMRDTVGLPQTVLADTGYASGAAVEALKAKMETDDAKVLYKKRKQSAETVFGIIKSAMGFRGFHSRGIKNAATEWTLITLASNCRRIHRLQAA